VPNSALRTATMMRGKHAPLPPPKEGMVAWERAERDTYLHASLARAKAHIDMSLPATMAMPHLASNRKREALERGTFDAAARRHSGRGPWC